MYKTYASFTSYLHNSWLQFRYIDTFGIFIQTNIIGYVCFGSRSRKCVPQIYNLDIRDNNNKCVNFKSNNDVSRNVLFLIEHTAYSGPCLSKIKR